MRILRQFIISSMAMGTYGLVQKIIGFALTPTLAYLLGPIGLGQYAVANETAATAQLVSRCGIDTGAHVLTAGRNASAESDAVSAILGNALTLFVAAAIGSGLALLVFHETVARMLFGDSSLAIFILLAAPFACFGVLGQYAYTAFAGVHDFRRYVAPAMFMLVVSAVCTVLGAWVGGAIGAAIGAVAAQAFSAFVLGVQVFRTCHKLGIRLRPRISKSVIIAILIAGAPFFVAQLFAAVSTYVLQGRLVGMHGIEALANLRVVTSISSIITFLPNLMGGPMISLMSAAHSQTDLRFSDVIYVTARVMWITSCIVVLFVGCLWQEIVNLLFGAQYQVASNVGSWAVLAVWGATLFQVVVGGLLSARRSKVLVYVSLAHGTTVILIGWVLIPSWGLSGYIAAQFFATALVVVGGGFFFACHVGREMSRQMAAMGLLTLGIVALVIYSAAISVDGGVFFRVLAVLAIATAVLAASAKILLSCGERQRLRALISEFVSRSRRAPCSE